MKLQKVKRFVALTLAGSMCLAMAACGNDAGSGSGASSADNGSETGAAQESSPAAGSSVEENAGGGDGASYAGKEITVWISSGAEDDVYREMFVAIGEELGITITDEYYSKDELDNKMQTSLITNDMPDAVVADYLLIPKYYDAGLIADLDDYVSDEMKNDFLPSVQASCTFNGKLISVAQFEAGLAIWGNKEMLEEAEVRIPESYTDAWDKAEFEDALKKLKDSGVEYPLYIRQNKPSTEYYTWMPIVASFGGDYMNRETGLCTGTLDSPETIEAFNYLAWLFEMGYCDATCDYEDSFEGKKENALALMGHHKFNDYAAGVGEDNLILIPLPDFGHGVYTCSGSTVLVMTNGAKEAGVDDAVAAMLDRAVSPEYIGMVVNVNGAVPARSSVMDSMEQYAEGGRFRLYREQLEAGISFLRPYTCSHMTIYDRMSSVIANIYTGADPESELKEAASYIDEIIMENGWNFQ